MGLKEILDDISRESDELNSFTLSAAKIEAENKMLQSAEEIERRRAEKKEELAADIKRRRIKLTAKAELDAYRERQKLEVSLIDSVLEEAFSELIKYINQNRETYLNFLKNLVKASVALIGTMPVEISLSKDDSPLFNELAKDYSQGELVLADSVKISGGVICSSGGSYVDNSIENIFEKQRPAFLKMISEDLA
jgi:vacuolar-type H+-ATPase subunit E/Vma4